MKKSLIHILNEIEDSSILSKLPRVRDIKQDQVKTSFTDKYSSERKIPSIIVYVKKFDPEIDGFGEYEKTDIFTINPEKVVPAGFGMGSKLVDPDPEELSDVYVNEVLGVIKNIIKTNGIDKLKPVGDGSNFISNSKVDTYSQYTPAEMEEWGFSPDDETKYAIFRIQIKGLTKSELNFLQSKLKESQMIQESNSVSENVVKESLVVDRNRLLILSNIKETSKKDEKKVIKENFSKVKDFRKIISDLIKEELNKIGK